MMHSMRPIAAITLAVSLIAVLTLLAVGTGYYLASRSFAGYLAHYEATTTLGRLLKESPIADQLKPIQRERIFTAYYEPDQVRLDAERISWGVHTVPTPFVGTAPSPGLQGNAHINRQQFRDRREVELPKPHGVYRIFLVGGSTAYGAGAPSDERTIGAYLERFLNESTLPTGHPRYELFTLANPAWSTTQERIAIENLLLEMEPDLVIAFSGNNDIFWGTAGHNVLWFRTFSDDHFWSIINRAYELGGAGPLTDVVHPAPGTVPPPLVAQRLETNVRLSTFALSLKKAVYLFVLQPTLAVTKKTLSEREQAFLNDQQPYYLSAYREIGSRLQDIQEDNFRFLDLSGLFDAYPADSELFLDSFHFGDRGNEQIASAIGSFLVSSVVTPAEHKEAAAHAAADHSPPIPAALPTPE